MSLGIYILPMPLKPLREARGEYVCSLDDDGYYWFLYPLFEKLNEQTGELIDLYGVAALHGEALESFAKTLKTACDLVEAQPEQWNVAVTLGGIANPLTNKLSEEIFETISKEKMTLLLKQLDEGARKAISTDAALLFFGD